MRRLEVYARPDLAQFEATLCRNDRAECARALLAAVSIYRSLRTALATPDLVGRKAAEEASVAYLETVTKRPDGESGRVATVCDSALHLASPAGGKTS